MSVAVVDLRCEGCGGGVEPEEEGRCAFCRAADRGDGSLLTHDSRGWVVGHEKRESPGRFNPVFLDVPLRGPCGCGCGQPECADRSPTQEESIVEEAQQVRTDAIPCKVPGCENTTTVTHGRYAKLCAEHRPKAATRRPAPRRPAPPAAPVAAQPSANGAGLTEQAHKLGELAQQVDAARAALEEAEAAFRAELASLVERATS
jgi:hypothetical protein